MILGNVTSVYIINFRYRSYMNMFYIFAANETCLITGGAGYPGYRLGKYLSSQGFRVILLDVHEEFDSRSDNIQYIKASIFLLH